jgi:hypothetical protein
MPLPSVDAADYFIISIRCFRFSRYRQLTLFTFRL